MNTLLSNNGGILGQFVAEPNIQSYGVSIARESKKEIGKRVEEYYALTEPP